MNHEYDAPHFAVEQETLVFDRPRQRQLMWLKGVVALPPGSLIELFDLHRSPSHGAAIVKQVRLLAAAEGASGAQVCLDCEVEPGWWRNEDDEAPSEAEQEEANQHVGAFLRRAFGAPEQP